MKNKELVKKYFDIFFVTHDFEALYQIFDDNLMFNGPFIQCNSNDQYIDSLKNDPPSECRHEIKSIFEKDNEVAVFYKFIKNSMQVSMAQLFTISGDKISSIELIFDSGKFN